MNRLFASLAFIGLGVASQASGADNLMTALADSTHFGFAKAMLVWDDKKGGRLDQKTPGFGGKIGLETGEYQGFRIKGAWYATSDLGLRQNDPGRTDAYMFDLDKNPYSMLGEMQISATHGKTRLIAGRQEFFSPMINTYDYRIIPNLFEAFTLINRDLPETTLTLSYVRKMSGLDGLVSFSDFRSMSQQLYSSLEVSGETQDFSPVIGHQGVWVFGIQRGQENRFQLWNYHGIDSLNMAYLDGSLKSQITPALAATVEGQSYHVAAVGKLKNYLSQRGLNANYAL